MSAAKEGVLPFVLPWRRREKVQWLMDQYTETRAIYPNARFDYVGHSNGTYLVASALEHYPAARFRRIVFAGSVVRSDYDWAGLISAGRVEKVLNFVATTDWVVALFPKAFTLRPFRAFDLGSAGHDGFVASRTTGIDKAQLVRSGEVYDLVYVKGRHGAAIEEHEWDEIAEFVVNGTPPDPQAPETYGLRERWLVACGYAAKWGLVPLIVLVVGAYAYFVASAFRYPWFSIASVAVVVGYFALYRLTRFVLLRL